MSSYRVSTADLVALVFALREGGVLVAVSDAVELARLLQTAVGSTDEGVAHAIGHLLARSSAEHERVVELVAAWLTRLRAEAARGEGAVETRRWLRGPPPALGRWERRFGWTLAVVCVAALGLGLLLGRDGDGDGHLWRHDCDDRAASTHLGAAELCNQIDEDCDGELDEWDAPGDLDGDGAPGIPAGPCPVYAGDEPPGTDCDDADASVLPGAEESCDGRDEDCSGVVDDAAPRFVDRDGDGYGTDAEEEACGGVGWWADRGGDCDDGPAAASIHPDAPDEDGDGVDQDCDGCDGSCTVACAPASLPLPQVQPERSGLGWVLLGLGAVLLTLGGAALLAWWRSRVATYDGRSSSDLLKAMDGPRVFGLGRHDVPGPLADSAVHGAARALRSQDTPGSRIDVARTVSATVRSQRPELRFQPQRGRARLLLLLDDAPRTRPWLARLEGLVQGLAGRGVEVELWKFAGRPTRLTRAPSDRPVALAALRGRDLRRPVQAAVLLQAAQGWWVSVVSAGEEDLDADALWWPALVNAHAAWLTPIEDPALRGLAGAPVPVFDTTPHGLLAWGRWLRTQETAARRQPTRSGQVVRKEDLEALVWVAGLLPEADAGRALSVLRAVEPGASVVLLDAVRGVPLGQDSEEGRERHRLAVRRLEEVDRLAELAPRVHRELERRIAASEPEVGSPAWLRWRLWRGWVRLAGDHVDALRGQQELVALAQTPVRHEIAGWLERTSSPWAEDRVGPIRAALAGPWRRPTPRLELRWLPAMAVMAGLLGWVAHQVVPMPAMTDGVERVGYAWVAEGEGFRLTQAEGAAPTRVVVRHDGVETEEDVGVVTDGPGCWEVSAVEGGTLWRSEVVSVPGERELVHAVVHAVVRANGGDAGAGVALIARGRLRDLDLTSAPGLLRRQVLGERFQIGVGEHEVVVSAGRLEGGRGRWNPAEEPELDVVVEAGAETGEGCLTFAADVGPYVLLDVGDAVWPPVPTGWSFPRPVGDVVKARAWRGDKLVDLPAVRVRPGSRCTTVDWGAEAARCQVYVQYADASAKAAAQAVQRALGAVCEVAEGLDRKPVDRWAVRYFHAEDRGDAERVWRATRAEAPDVLLQDLSAQYPDTPLGQIEVWVPTEKPPDCVLAANSLSGKSSATELLAREVKERCRSLEIVFLDVEVDPWTIGFVQPAWEAAARRLAKQVRHYPKADAELPPWQVVKVSPGPGQRSDVLYFFGDKSYTMLDLEAVGSSATAVAVDGGEAKALPATWALPAGSHRLAVVGGPEETVNLEADVDTRRCWQPKEQRWTEGPCQRPFNIPVVTFGPATFTMGSPADEEGRDENETQHKVTVPRRFALATTEVSQGLYREVMGTNPSRWDNGIGDDLPVNMVSWLDAVKFCTKLSLREGLTPAYSAPGEVDAWEAEDVVWAPAADGWRLPTEAEWELAARAAGEGVYGSTSEPAEVCRFANVADASAKAKGVGFGDERFPCDDGFVWLAPVGSLRAQAGLHHMLGNVWELTWDWYAEDITGETMDAGGPAGGVYRVYRGGSFNDPPRDVRVAGRTWFDPSFPYVYLGFRLARTLPSAL